MAAKKPNSSSKPSPSTDLARHDVRLAAYAQAAVATEANTGAGIKSVSLKSGVLSLDDVPFRNNEMACIVIDHVLLNRFDDTDYDPDAVSPPKCFAIARTEEEMAPHPSVVERGQQECDTCRNCPQNQFGSADKGRGKACKNRRRLLILDAGEITKDGSFEMVTDPDHYKLGDLAFLNLPVMSTMSWAAYVKQLKSGLNKPPLAVVTHVKLVPDPKSQFKLEFQVLEEITDEAMLVAIMDRHDECTEIAAQPLNLDAPEEAERSARSAKGGKKDKSQGRASGKPAARGAACARRY